MTASVSPLGVDIGEPVREIEAPAPIEVPSEPETAPVETPVEEPEKVPA